MRISLHPEALDEFLDAVKYLAEDSTFAPEQFIAEVEEALNEISLFPYRFPRYGKNYRVKHLTGFEYSLFYRIKGEVVRINAIAHQKRKPGYWRYRT